MNHKPSATSPGYQQQFNKELSKQLKSVRQAQPDHIPVFAMKYKNASKYLTENLQQSLALFPKKFLLCSVYDIIQKQSLQFCHDKLKQDPTVLAQGPKFKLPQFFLYTISMVSSDQIMCKNYIKSQQKSPNPIGTFVKLDLQMTFEQAFQKYGRENVLTVVYTDAAEVNSQYNRMALQVQKCLIRVIFFILILVLVPFLMKSESQNFQTQINMEMKNNSQKSDEGNRVGKNDVEDCMPCDNIIDIDVVDSQVLTFRQEKTINYDDELI